MYPNRQVDLSSDIFLGGQSPEPRMRCGASKGEHAGHESFKQLVELGAANRIGGSH